MTHRSWKLFSLALISLTGVLSSPARATPDLFITPNVAILDFGTTTVGSPIDRLVVLNNTGTSDLIIYGFSVPSGFSLIGAPTPFQPIFPGGARFMSIRMNATTQGTFSGQILISSNEPFSQVRVSVTGVVTQGGGGGQFFIVEPNADAFVQQEDPDLNAGSSTVLRIRRANSGLGRFSFLRFFVPFHSGTVQSAVLRIRTRSAAVPQASLYDVNIGWNENTITWNNWQNGGTTYSLLRGVGPLAAETWHEIDVREAISAGGGSLTLGIATTAEVGGLSFYSRESSFAPTLEVIVN